MSTAINHRYDFVFFYDVENGNPNGDPDAGNMPRMDPETGIGIVSDVCIKRKIRNYVELSRGCKSGFRIYVQDGAILNDRNEEAYLNTGIAKQKGKLPKKLEDQRAVTSFMCENFYDIRTFGAVMTTEVNCGQVRGPVQLCFSKSVDPILPAEMSITRMAVTNAKDAENKKANRTMGRKAFIPYGLYRLEGFVSASLAGKSGFDEGDLSLLWEALMNMFEDDRSAARGLMTSRLLVVFEHESKLGNAPAHKLFDLVNVSRVTEGCARSYSDYKIEIMSEALPQGVRASIYDYIPPSE